MDREVLVQEMTERFQERYSQALASLEKAADGEWISASEHVFHDAFQQLLTESYGAALKNKVEQHATADQAAFSPSRQSGCSPA